MVILDSEETDFTLSIPTIEICMKSAPPAHQEGFGGKDFFREAEELELGRCCGLLGLLTELLD